MTDVATSFTRATREDQSLVTLTSPRIDIEAGPVMATPLLVGIAAGFGVGLFVCSQVL